MKKIGLTFVILLLAVLSFSFTACGKQTLTTPVNIVMDENNVLSWILDENAKNYSVNVKNVSTGEEKQYTSRKASYDLSKLQEGDYDISIKAVGDGKNYTDSEWSVVLNFHKDYETGCIYTLVKNNTEYEITKVGSASETVYIESEYRGKPVTSIADAAFKGSGRVKAIEIGDNVTYIGDNAFYNCPKITSVVMSDAVTYLGISAFQSCRSLSSVYLSKGLTELSDYVFAYCRSLETVEIPENVTVIGNSAFSDCSSLKSVVIPDNVKSVGEYAFTANTALTSVEIGDSVKEIGKNAFCKCSALTEIVFSDEGALSVLGEYAFSDCSEITALTLPEGLSDIGYACFYNDIKLESVTIPESVMHVGRYAFFMTKFFTDAYTSGEKFIYADNWLVYCKEETLKEITVLDLDSFKEGTVGIADYTFEKTEKLAEIYTPATLKVIGKYAFSQGKEIWKIETYDNSVEIVDEYAFFFCKCLTQIMFREGLKQIGDYAFYGCSLLDNKTVGSSIIPDSVTSIGMYAFKNTALWNKPNYYGIVYAGNWVVGYNGMWSSSVSFEKNTVGVADYAFYKCSTLKTVEGLSDAKYIGKGAFYGCTSLVTVTLSTNLKKIEDYTFYECVSLYSVKFPIGLQRIGRSAFYKCFALESVKTSGTQLSYIDDYAFYGCISLSEVTFGRRLTEIGECAFYANGNLKSVSFPSSLKVVGDRAFYKCSALSELNFGDGVEEIGDSSFAYCQTLTSINTPSSLKVIGDRAFYNCPNIEKISLAEGVEKIGHYAFYDMKKVKTLILPSSLNEIGNYAFKGLSGVNSIIVKSSVEKIGSHAFYGCLNATIYSDASGIMPDWNTKYNSSYRPIVWNCAFSQDGEYVKSVEIKENGILNGTAVNGIASPERVGYAFKGWTTNTETNDVAYVADEISSVPVGTVIYAVWEELSE